MPVLQLYTHSPLRNFSYIVHGANGDGDTAVVIDPWDAAPILQELKTRNLSLKAIVNTHEHHDHIRGNKALSQATGAPVWCHPLAAAAIGDVTGTLNDGDVIQLGQESLVVMDCPGHTFAHLCLLVLENDKPYAVITGDTLFQAGVGNCRNGGDPEVLWETIENRFGPLADNIVVYTGHDYLLNNLQFAASLTPKHPPVISWLDRAHKLHERGETVTTSLKEERQINHFLRLDAPEWQSIIANKAQSHFGPGPYSAKDVFLFLRWLRDQW